MDFLEEKGCFNYLTSNPIHCLVTGGAGFIGSHLTDKLIHLGFKVTVLDNFSSGKRTNLSDVISDIHHRRRYKR